MITPPQIFYESLKTEAAKKAYRLWLEQFFEYANVDYDSIIKLEPENIKQIIKEYVIYKKELTRKTGKPITKGSLFFMYRPKTQRNVAHKGNRTFNQVVFSNNLAT